MLIANQDQLDRDHTKAAGIRGMPTAVINGDRLEGALTIERYRAKIETALQR